MAHWSDELIKRFIDEAELQGCTIYSVTPSGTVFRPTMRIVAYGNVTPLVNKYDDMAEREKHVTTND